MVAIGLLLAGLMAAPAEAAKRKVPFGFFGVTMIGELTNPGQLPDAKLDQQMALMAGSGVESTRVTFSSGGLEPARGVYTWGSLDRLVAAAARHHIAVMVNISTSAPWSSSKPNSPEYWRYPPKDPKDFAELMRQAVLRYGPKGSFWVAEPGDSQGAGPQVAGLERADGPVVLGAAPLGAALREAAEGVVQGDPQADRKAIVIAGSLMSYGSYHQWDGVRAMYRAGAKKYFDEIAVHPFTNDRSARVTANQTIEIIRRVRAEMRKRHDTRKGIEVTEMTWAAAKGIVPPNAIFGMETTAKGQAARLKSLLREADALPEEDAHQRASTGSRGPRTTSPAATRRACRSGSPAWSATTAETSPRCRCSAPTGASRPRTRAAASPRALEPASARNPGVTTFGTSVLAGVAVGGGLGLLLGGLALWLSWRQMEPRMTSVAQSYRTTGIPTTPLDDLEPGEAGAIIRRWEAMSARPSSRIALVAADRKLEPLARRRRNGSRRCRPPDAAGERPRACPGLHDRRPTWWPRAPRTGTPPRRPRPAGAT